MSLRGKDFRCELDPEMHEQLRMIAEFHDQDVARIGARLLEKAIAGEWHEFSLIRERMERSGKLRNPAEARGIARKRTE